MKKIRDYRKEETELAYQRYLAEYKGGCPFCLEASHSRKIVKDYQYWFITENLYPYDKFYSISHLLIPKRHLVFLWDLNEQEMAEFLQIKRQLSELGYDEILENLPSMKTQRHFHQHLLAY